MRIKKRTLKIMLVLLVLLIAVMAALRLNSRAKANAMNADLQKYYSAKTGYDAEILEVKKVSGKYDAKIRINSQTISKLLDDEQIRKIRAWLGYYERFKTCLDKNNIKIFVANNQESYWQLAVLPLIGKDAAKYLVNCDANSKACQNAGISATPSLLYNGHVYPGPKVPKLFMGMTDCEPANYGVVIQD